MFNEVYGAYYFLMEQILEAASHKSINIKEINDIINKYGFSESSLYFTPNVTSQGKSYNLLKKTDSGYTSVLQAPPVLHTTYEQKRFVKTMLSDKRIRLFIENDAIARLNALLTDVPPLYDLSPF